MYAPWVSINESASGALPMSSTLLSTIIFLLSIGTIVAEPLGDSSVATDDDRLLFTIYKTCWSKCDLAQGKKNSQEALLRMMLKKESNHTEYCKPYLTARACAMSCVSKEDHHVYLKPFFRRNYLNDFICYKHSAEFARFLPCYQNRTSLEFLFERCGYFALSNQEKVIANKETCSRLDCVMRVIPLIVQRDCKVENEDDDFANQAAELMEKLVGAFLREGVKLNRLQKHCMEMTKI